jgi:hypothetical protein
MEETVMRIFTITATAASLVMLTAAANAQYTERRDLLDPFGVWSGSQLSYQQQIFSPGPPSKTGAHFGPRYSNDNNFGYPSWMPGRL